MIKPLQEYQGGEKENLSQIVPGDYVAEYGVGGMGRKWEINIVERTTPTQILTKGYSEPRRYWKKNGDGVGNSVSLYFTRIAPLSKSETWGKSGTTYYFQIVETEKGERKQALQRTIWEKVREKATSHAPLEILLAMAIVGDHTTIDFLREHFPEETGELLDKAWGPIWDAYHLVQMIDDKEWEGTVQGLMEKYSEAWTKLADL